MAPFQSQPPFPHTPKPARYNSHCQLILMHILENTGLGNINLFSGRLLGLKPNNM